MNHYALYFWETISPHGLQDSFWKLILHFDVIHFNSPKFISYFFWSCRCCSSYQNKRSQYLASLQFLVLLHVFSHKHNNPNFLYPSLWCWICEGYRSRDEKYIRRHKRISSVYRLRSSSRLVRTELAWLSIFRAIVEHVSDWSSFYLCGY